MQSSLLAATSIALTLGLFANQAEAKKVRPAKVQIAVLLDTSGSMDGLINQAKSELWTIVNRFSESTYQGRDTELEVALYEYGKSSISVDEGHLRMITGFTADLDLVSEQLFALRTNGGDEFAGLVIDKALSGLAWSQHPSDYKAIFIAGNEPFNQGPTPYVDSVGRAVGRSIIINTIHCGSISDGIIGKWKHAAQIGEGTFLTIEQNHEVMEIATPYDKEIAALSTKINGTYVRYGRQGAKKMARQRAQDANASSMGAGVAAKRAKTKSGRSYKNTSWDLVDMMEDESSKHSIETMRSEDLPKEMRSMNKTERKAFVKGKAGERKALKAKIRKLSGKRDKYIAAERKKAKADTTSTFDRAVVKTVDKQMRAKGYVFKKE